MSDKQKEVIKLVSAIGATIFAIGVAWGTNKKSLSDTQKRVDCHETRLDSIEQHMVEQRTDIKWIRQTMEKNH